METFFFEFTKVKQKFGSRNKCRKIFSFLKFAFSVLNFKSVIEEHDRKDFGFVNSNLHDYIQTKQICALYH